MRNYDERVGWKKINTGYEGEYIIFALGILAGFLVLLIPQGRKMSGLTNNEIQNLFTSFFWEVDYFDFLLYLLARRLAVFGIVVAFSLLWICKYVVKLAVFIYGFMIGNLFILLLLEYGMRGIVFFALLLMPHGLFYFFAYMRLAYTVCKMNALFCEKKMQPYVSNTTDIKNIMTELVGELGVTIIGILTECYVNLRFIKIIVNIL